MKIASTHGGGFYIRYFLVSAFTFGCLLIDFPAPAQNELSWGGSRPDNKYGEGGTKEVHQDNTGKVTKWKDKDGHLREAYLQPNNTTASETWSFYDNGGEMVAKFSWREKKFWAGEILRGVDTNKEDALRLIEKIEKQFAEDGTTPPDLFAEDGTISPNPVTKEVDTEVKQPDLSKIPQVSAKKNCDGLREKIRTLQDLLRKRQADPASPKQDLEAIRKQIDELLNQLADCPKQEPIDAQFDCLKSKFPGIQRSSDKKDAASDPTSKRNFAWDTDKQAWIDENTKESICPPGDIDPCLIGTWECTSFKEANKFITGGGTGFRVTFKSDGTETVDYSKMQPIRAGDDKMVYEGKATARISAKDGVGKIQKMIEAAAKFNATFMAKRYGKEWNPKIPGLGPGGLGSTKGENKYKCTGDSLEYQSSTARGAADCTVKLTRVKPEEPSKGAGETRAQEAAMLKPIDDAQRESERQKEFEKNMAEVDAGIKKLKEQVEAQKREAAETQCNGLKGEIRKLQDSLVSMKEKEDVLTNDWMTLSTEIRRTREKIQKAWEENNEAERGRQLDRLNEVLGERDSVNAKTSSLQTERAQATQQIEDLMTRLSDCKSKP